MTKKLYTDFVKFYTTKNYIFIYLLNYFYSCFVKKLHSRVKMFAVSMVGCHLVGRWLIIDVIS